MKQNNTLIEFLKLTNYNNLYDVVSSPLFSHSRNVNIETIHFHRSKIIYENNRKKQENSYFSYLDQKLITREKERMTIIHTHKQYLK